jgi:hypothetical protein
VGFLTSPLTLIMLETELTLNSNNLVLNQAYNLKTIRTGCQG